MTHAQRIALGCALADGDMVTARRIAGDTMNTINPKWLSIKPTYVQAAPQQKAPTGRVRHTEAAGEQISFKDLSRPGGRARETYTHTSPQR